MTSTATWYVPVKALVSQAISAPPASWHTGVPLARVLPGSSGSCTAPVGCTRSAGVPGVDSTTTPLPVLGVKIMSAAPAGRVARRVDAVKANAVVR